MIINKHLKQLATVTPKVYGAQWAGGESTAWIRTDDAADLPDPVPYAAGETDYGSPFDSIYPWSGMTVEVVRISNVDQIMVRVPVYWYKITVDGHALKIQIRSAPADGFAVSPAHADRGDGSGYRGFVYVSRYLVNANYNSVSGSSPVGTSVSAFRPGIHNKSSNLWLSDFAMYWTLRMLYLVEYADWDAQYVIGYGRRETDSESFGTAGQTDTMPYHTGCMGSKTSFGYQTQYRYVEGMWAYGCEWIDGLYAKVTSSASDTPGVFVGNNPAYYGETYRTDTRYTTQIGTKLPLTSAASQYLIKYVSSPEVAGLSWAILPSELMTYPSAGDHHLYISDAMNGTDRGYACRTHVFGGRPRGLGLFAFYAGNYETDYATSTVARSMILP